MKQQIETYALLINDLHVSRETISDFEANWRDAISVCLSNGIERVIIGGDLWTNRASQTLDVLMSVRWAVLYASANGISLIIAEGNHDKVNQDSRLGYSHIFSEYPNVSVVDDYIALEISERLFLVTVSYFPENGTFGQVLEDIRKSYPADRTILYIHEGINGAISTGSEKELPASVFEDFAKVLVGHYHDRCKVGDNIEYIGSSRQHNFGEDSEKGYTLLRADGTTEFVRNNVNTTFCTFNFTPETIDKKAIEEAVENGMKVRVKIECDSEKTATVNRQELFELGVSKVEVKTADSPVASASRALEVKYDKSSIAREYVDFCQKREIPNMEIGLNYLQKIK